MAGMVRLGYWSPSGGGYERLYVNGLPIPATAKVWLEHGRGGLKVKFLEECGLDAEDVLAAVRVIAPGGQLDWETLVALAKSTPSPRGGRAGSTAASRGFGAKRPWEDNQRPWTAADVHALPSVDMSANPIPTLTTLLVDHREPAEMVDHLRTVQNLDVQIAQLEVGDYVVPGKLIVERKTASDLVTSVTEDAKRLFFQTEAMANAEAASCVLLIEGDIYSSQRMTLQALGGTLSFLAVVQRVSVLPTLNLKHSAMEVAKLVRHAAHGLGYDLGLRGSGPKDPGEAGAFVLQGIPGVSAARAISLLRHFGSLAAVATATAAELRLVDGIGPKTAATISATFSARHSG